MVDGVYEALVECQIIWSHLLWQLNRRTRVVELHSISWSQRGQVPCSKQSWLFKQIILSLRIYVWNLKRPPTQRQYCCMYCFRFWIPHSKLSTPAWNGVCLSLYVYTVACFEHHIRNRLLSLVMLNKEHTTPARPVSLSLYLYLKIK
jgi:hypothetical protein